MKDTAKAIAITVLLVAGLAAIGYAALDGEREREDPDDEPLADTILQVQRLQYRIDLLEGQLADLQAEHARLKREHDHLENWARDRGY